MSNILHAAICKLMDRHGGWGKEEEIRGRLCLRRDTMLRHYEGKELVPFDRFVDICNVCNIDPLNLLAEFVYSEQKQGDSYERIQ